LYHKCHTWLLGGLLCLLIVLHYIFRRVIVRVVNLLLCKVFRIHHPLVCTQDDKHEYLWNQKPACVMKDNMHTWLCFRNPDTDSRLGQRICNPSLIERWSQMMLLYKSWKLNDQIATSLDHYSGHPSTKATSVFSVDCRLLHRWRMLFSIGKRCSLFIYFLNYLFILFYSAQEKTEIQPGTNYKW